jgi:hypothetical protein
VEWSQFRLLMLNGGRVTDEGDERVCWLPPTAVSYADAQFDDYGLEQGRARFRWRPGTRLRLQAQFSHEQDEMLGTAGFGFWNAPFGDPTMRRPSLPQATWFFFASDPSDLPLAWPGPGRGWFAATLDAGRKTAVPLAPLAPIILLLNRLPALERRLWPAVRRRLAISFAPIPATMTAWREYELIWQPEGCHFLVDGQSVLETAHSPRGPLGFVCWVDNQYMVATRNGRFRSGTLPTPTSQSLRVRQLTIEAA